MVDERIGEGDPEPLIDLDGTAGQRGLAPPSRRPSPAP